MSQSPRKSQHRLRVSSPPSRIQPSESGLPPDDVDRMIEAWRSVRPPVDLVDRVMIRRASELAVESSSTDVCETVVTREIHASKRWETKRIGSLVGSFAVATCVTACALLLSVSPVPSETPEEIASAMTPSILKPESKTGDANDLSSAIALNAAPIVEVPRDDWTLGSSSKDDSALKSQRSGFRNASVTLASLVDEAREVSRGLYHEATLAMTVTLNFEGRSHGSDAVPDPTPSDFSPTRSVEAGVFGVWDMLDGQTAFGQAKNL
ncbi:hypothetical protein [Stratiformator vulcanicus]|uniref:Uncharacterized protein n=1 Tax=Stratiformator vulcanicus TaxID=2527980 RepID=A0A517R382_9PLAN|nr:hypothetical protein [Stratiformator vulcanicus]QDT38324.1 hypothetical protein Pan189_27150 [Stratiformator vulcanicus]